MNGLVREQEVAGGRSTSTAGTTLSSGPAPTFWRVSSSRGAYATWTTSSACRHKAPSDASSDELGSYHCWNRIYDIKIGCFTTPDPPMSPWSNLQDYVGNNPLSRTDPSGLSPDDDESLKELDKLRAEWQREKTANGLSLKWKTKPTATGPCGGAKMEIEWELDTKEDGWIVQYVFRQIDTEDCEGNELDSRTESYWEAWRVIGGVIYKGYASAGVGAHDEFTLPDASGYHPNGSRGEFHMVGAGAKFIADGDFVRDHFKGKKAKRAGILPSTYKRPDGFANLTGRRHEMDVYWDCCCDPHEPTEVDGSIDSEETTWRDVWK